MGTCVDELGVHASALGVDRGCNVIIARTPRVGALGVGPVVTAAGVVLSSGSSWPIGSEACGVTGTMVDVSISTLVADVGDPRAGKVGLVTKGFRGATTTAALITVCATSSGVGVAVTIGACAAAMTVCIKAAISLSDR